MFPFVDTVNRKGWGGVDNIANIEILNERLPHYKSKNSMLQVVERSKIDDKSGIQKTVNKTVLFVNVNDLDKNPIDTIRDVYLTDKTKYEVGVL